MTLSSTDTEYHLVHRYEHGESETYAQALKDFSRWMDHVQSDELFLRGAYLGYEIDYDTKKGIWLWMVRWAEVPASSVRVEYPSGPKSIGEV